MISILVGCTSNPEIIIGIKTPIAGQNLNAGDPLVLSLDVPEGVQVDTTHYLVDGKSIASQISGKPLSLDTKDWPLGYRLITAIVKYQGKTDTLNVNIVLKSKFTPQNLSYKLLRRFPHDTTAYTQGLSYTDGKILESTGKYGHSFLKWVDLNSGKTLKQTPLGRQYFGEGSLKIGDKIIMLTWQENTGFVFDAKSFKQLGTFPYQSSREGWGLAYNGRQILRSDGSNRIWLMNKDTYLEEGFIEVYDHKGEVNNLNELEFIEGKIYANVYLTNKIVRIDPATGKVEAQVDLSALVPKDYFKTINEAQQNVLNGIAWDEKIRRLFVTGKKWPHLYEIKLEGLN